MLSGSGPWLWWLVGIYFTMPLAIYIILPYLLYRGPTSRKKVVTLIVLGDVGHSPRMCYHATLFSNLDYQVNLCGYVESEPPLAVIEDVNIDIIPIHAIQNKLNLPYFAFAAQKVVLQLFQLFKLLADLRYTNYYFIQNPPSVPVLAIVVLFMKFFNRRAKLIIDWHNLNYTILQLKIQNESHPFVKVLKLYEKYLARFAFLNITVTHSMKNFLIEDFNLTPLKIVILHDRPGEQFVPLKNESQKEAIIKKQPFFQDVQNINDYKILVTSTSYTPDEDLNGLLDSLKIYDVSSRDLPPLLLIITGKGPLKQQFLTRVAELKFLKRILVKSVWLEAEDYPKVLSVADLAISLHRSSSGMDLPMKILDFFGVGLPVISLQFPAIGELVKDNFNGMIVNSGKKTTEKEEMARSIISLTTDPMLLEKLRKGALQESHHRWDDNWKAQLGSIFPSIAKTVLNKHN